MTNGQPTGVRPLPDLAGRIAFLGTCDNAAHVLDRAGVPVVNILGLKLEVVSCVYPLPLNKFSFCVAFRDAASLPKLRIALKDRNDVQLLGFDVSFESKDRATVTPGDVHLRGYLPVSSSWMVAILRPEELKKNVLSLMSEPGVLRVTAISEGFSEENWIAELLLREGPTLNARAHCCNKESASSEPFHSVRNEVPNLRRWHHALRSS